MKLRKDNVVKVVTSEREINHFKSMGYTEVLPDEKGAGEPVPSSASAEKENQDRASIKAELDCRGVTYAANTSTKNLAKLLESAKGDAK